MRMKKLASLTLAVIFAAVALTGCGSTPSGEPGYPNKEGYAEGRMGDTMHTYFFDYTVNSAYVCDTYEGYTPTSSNKELVVTEITVKNTHNASIEMYDSDFQIQWGDDVENDFDYPITLNFKSGETIGENMLPDIYKLAINESRTGIIVFEVSSGKEDFSISYTEYFNNDTTGDTFFVFFSADKKESRSDT